MNKIQDIINNISCNNQLISLKISQILQKLGIIKLTLSLFKFEYLFPKQLNNLNQYKYLEQYSLNFKHYKSTAIMEHLDCKLFNSNIINISSNTGSIYDDKRVYNYNYNYEQQKQKQRLPQKQKQKHHLQHLYKSQQNQSYTKHYYDQMPIFKVFPRFKIQSYTEMSNKKLKLSLKSVNLDKDEFYSKKVKKNLNNVKINKKKEKILNQVQDVNDIQTITTLKKQKPSKINLFLQKYHNKQNMQTTPTQQYPSQPLQRPKPSKISLNSYMISSTQKSNPQSQSPYRNFGISLLAKKQFIRLKQKKNQIFVMSQIQKLTKDNNNNYVMKYTQIQDSQMSNIITIKTIKQRQHPGPKIYKKRKQAFKSVNQVKVLNNIKTNLHSHPNNPSTFFKPIFDQYPQIDNDQVYKKKIFSYINFIYKVNYSNNINKCIQLTDKYNQIKKYKVFVGRGNNNHLVKVLLKRRFWLEVVDRMTEDVVIVWTQSSQKDVHDRQKKNNSINSEEKKQDQSEKIIIDKQPSILRDRLYSLKNQSSEFSQCFIEKERKVRRVSVKIDQKQQNSTQSQFKKVNSVSIQKKFSNSRNQHNKKLFINQSKSQQCQRIISLKIVKMLTKSNKHSSNHTLKTQPIIQSLTNFYQISNHLPQNQFIGSKKALFYSLQFYYKRIKKCDPFRVIPKTYHFSSNNNKSFTQFMQAQNIQNNSDKIWILKPGQYTNRGNGIKLIKQSQITQQILCKKEQHNNGQKKTIILQKYLTNPLLYYGRKFDIRHYILITSINSCIKAYWYQQGYIRTCSQLFTLQNLQSQYIHLTNDAIQQHCPSYGKYQQANKLSYSELQRYIDNEINININMKNKNNNNNNKIDFKEHVLTRMKEITIDVIKANYLNIDRERCKDNFQIFGMDFMIDNKFNVWLIQINSNPCLQINCPLLSRIIPIMIQHSLRLTIDTLIIPSTHFPSNKRYFLPDNILDNLKYQIIFDELEQNKQDKQQMRKLLEKEDFLKQCKEQPQDQYENQGEGNNIQILQGII